MSNNHTPKRKKTRGSGKDGTLRYATVCNPNLEQWRILAAEWAASIPDGKSDAMKALKIFLLDYIDANSLETDPARFFRATYSAPCFYETCLKHIKTEAVRSTRYSHVMRFIKYVLDHYFSIEDDQGHSTVPPEFRSPIPPKPADRSGGKGQPDTSNKNVLPYKFISQLRNILCPLSAENFSDWKWAQTEEDNTKGGNWFVVPSTLINEADPDCVWRERPTSSYERTRYGYGESVHEIWSPVRAVALYLKLQLPLRTHQVRMLDSGEADTHRYQQGKWVANDGPLAKGIEKNPYRRGVFRQMTDGINNVAMTGLFINTNKTADRGKDEWSKGYTIPWEHPEVLHWLEKLRNWQERYNSVSSPTPWTELELKHTGDQVADGTLKAMGASCFLFRDAAAAGADRAKPITRAVLEGVWFRLLLQLESNCLEDNLLDLTGEPLLFVSERRINRTTNYPLHALRVSLITAYALEGGVPLAILSKCIAGHARLVMTLYYTKAGITYCTETMDAATKRLLVQEQENYVRWLKDKTYAQLEANGAFFDPAAIHAVMRATQFNASLVKDDKGLCPKGGWGCDSGGVYVNDDTGKVTYGEVPGYPQKNCPRCRWFFTGPAFLDGLQNHWNHIQLSMGDVGERIVRLEGEIIALEEEQYECQASDLPFLHQDKLNTLRKVHQAEYEKNNKNAEDSNATIRLISRCKVISRLQREGEGDDTVQLVAVGALENVEVAISECDKLHQILTAVAGSTVYPEHDVSKAVLQASKAFDMMLAKNGQEPVLFRLDENELPVVVQHITKLLATEAGSIKRAVPFVEGKQRLVELGLDIDIEQLAREMAATCVVHLPAASGEHRALLA